LHCSSDRELYVTIARDSYVGGEYMRLFIIFPIVILMDISGSTKSCCDEVMNCFDELEVPSALTLSSSSTSSDSFAS